MRGLARLLSPLRIFSSRLSLLCHRFSSTCSPLPLSTAAAATAVANIADAATSQPMPPLRPRPLNLQARLTPEEIAQVNLLVPRLCESGRLQEAVRLVDACLLTDPPLDSLPLPALVRRLCCGDEPGMTHPMALLTALLHNPRCSPGNLGAICSMLVDSYLEYRRPKDALKVFDWMLRPKSPSPPGPDVCRRVVQGLCRQGRTLEALRVLTQVVGDGGSEVVGSDVRTCVSRSLLNEARVREAQVLDRVFAGIGEGVDGACERAVEVLDQMIKNWQD